MHVGHVTHVGDAEALAGRGAHRPVGGRRVPAGAVGLIDAHVLDAYASRAQAGQRLERVEVLGAVPAVPAAGVAVNRADQPGLLVIAQCRLAQPAAPGHLLGRETCHAGSRTHLKRLKSNADAYLCVRSGPWP